MTADELSLAFVVRGAKLSEKNEIIDIKSFAVNFVSFNSLNFRDTEWIFRQAPLR